MAERRHPFRGMVVTVAVFLVMVLALWLGLSQVDHRSGDAETAALEAAVRRAAVLCYSVEGRYPYTVEELCRNYGLIYNQDRFIISMDAFASNLLPDIRVLAIGGDVDGE